MYYISLYHNNINCKNSAQHLEIITLRQAKKKNKIFFLTNPSLYTELNDHNSGVFFPIWLVWVIHTRLKLRALITVFRAVDRATCTFLVLKFIAQLL